MAGRSSRKTGKARDTSTRICTKRDADGIDIYFLSYRASSVFNTVLSSPVADILRDFKIKSTEYGMFLHAMQSQRTNAYNPRQEAFKQQREKIQC
jgi:hypothetical protein